LNQKGFQILLESLTSCYIIKYSYDLGIQGAHAKSGRFLTLSYKLVGEQNQLK
jgi:hypothetical protein